MFIIDDVLSKVVQRKEFWPHKRTSPLAIAYRELRMTLGDGKLEMSPSHSGRAHYSRHRTQSSKDLVVMCKNERLLKELCHPQYIYLTPISLFMERPLGSHDKFEYVAILKTEGRVGYTVLILGFESLSYDFDSPGYELCGGMCGLMEVLSDGTVILFDRTVSWEKVKECKVNTTAIRNLFFNQNEIKLIASIVDGFVSNHSSDKNSIYLYRHEDAEIDISPTVTMSVDSYHPDDQDFDIPF